MDHGLTKLNYLQMPEKGWTRTEVENQVIMLRHKGLDVQLAESKERVLIKDTRKKYGKLATT